MATGRSIRRGMLSTLVAGTAAVALAIGGAVPAAAEAEPTTTITGTVTRGDDGTPVEGVSVFVSDTAGGFSFNGYSDADGDYEVTGLPAGEYVVRFAPEGLPDLVSEYWNDAPDWDTAQRLTTAGGEIITDVDAALELGGMISGSVMRDSDGAPVEGVAVAVSAQDGSWSADLAWSRQDGSFLVGGLPAGDYTVRFDAPDGSGVIGEYWDDAADSASATLVSVVAGEEQTGIVASLAETALISGRVTRDSDGGPVEGTVEIRAVGDLGGTSVPTEADGSYRIETAPGSYILHFRSLDGQLFDEYWDDAPTPEEATVVTVAAGEQLTALDAALAAGTVISGVVSADGDPLSDITVMALRGDEPAGSATTSDDGAYSIRLAPGDYVLRASASLGEPIYASEYFEDAVTQDDATVLSLTADEDLTGIDIEMDLGVDIRGTLSFVDGEGAGGEGATVTAYRWSGAEWVEAARVPSWGDFSFSPDPWRDGGILPAGRYTFSVQALGYCTKFFGGAVSIDDAESFDLAAGGMAVDADVALSVECVPAEAKPALTLSAASIRAGKEITVSGTGFAAAQKVAFELHSEPVALGSLTADETGALSGSLRVPAGTPAGVHTLVALDASGAVIASVTLTVTAASGGAVTGGEGALATTGSELPSFAVMMAAALLLIGATLVRRRRAHS